jgi:taurine--2-oxoglutarate transaminase
MIENENDVAAVVVEPIVGTNGILIPPPEYMPRLREICDRHGVLLIADEVMTGWGRTGKWFAMEHWGVTPDILVTAKGITSAYTPLGLCATNNRIASYFDDHYFGLGHTYEAHPLMLAAAAATIRELKRLDLIERAREMGTYLGERLQALKLRHPSIGDVRGIGLFWAVDLVKDGAGKTPFNTKADKVSGKSLVIDRVAGQMMQNGVAIQAWISHLVVAPPLIVTREEIDFAVGVMDRALEIADEAITVENRNLALAP